VKNLFEIFLARIPGAS